MKLVFILVVMVLACGCAAKKPAVQPVPAPPAIAPKPKPRPVRSGDYILKGAEILPDGTVVCHRPIQMIDSTRRREEVTVYQCR